MKSFSILMGLSLVMIAVVFLTTPAGSAFADEERTVPLSGEGHEEVTTENQVNQTEAEPSQPLESELSEGHETHHSENSTAVHEEQAA